MARQKAADTVETLRKQQAELTRKLKEAETKARKETQERERHLNDLVGAIARKELAANPSGAFALNLLGLLAIGITRPADRAALHLSALQKEPKAAPVPKATAPVAATPAPSVTAPPVAAPAASPYSLAAMGGAKVSGGV